MSKVVDDRVVEMRFDNSNFESNVKTSMNTLERLKAAMKFENATESLRGLEKTSKNMKFDNLVSSVANIESRFSILGIAGKRAIENITDSMMGFAKKTASFLTSGVINGGITRAMNLENAHFQLQMLLKDEQAVAAVMKNVNEAVDGTAYSMDAAAKVASQLAASGIRAGDQMTSSLKAVAGVAALTNSSYEDIGRIFTQVAGQGRLMGQDLLQLSSRGMNAAAEIAKYLNKTESEVRDMVSKGQISFEIFSAAMNSAFGDSAKRANETFNGAMSNVKASLARIGAEFVSPIIVQNGPLVQFFNTLRERINEVKASIGPLADVFTTAINRMLTKLTTFLSKLDFSKPFEKFKGLNSKWDDFEAKIKEAGVSTDAFQSKLKEVAAEHGLSLDKMIKKEGSLANVMSSGKVSKDMVIETLKRMAGAQEEAASSTEDYTAKLKYFQDVVKKVWHGDYKNGEARIKALTDAGYDYAQVQDLVNKTVDDHTVSLEDLTDAQLINIGYTEEEVSAIRKLAEEAEKAGTPLNELISNLEKPSGKELFLKGLSNLLQAVLRPLKAFGRAWREIFTPKSADDLYNSVAAFEKFTSKLVMSEETMDKLTRTFKGLFAAIDLVATVTSGALRFAFNVLCEVLGIANVDILTVTAYIGDAIVKFREWVTQHSLLSKAIDAAVTGIAKFIKWIAKLFKKLYELPAVQKGLDKLADGFKKVYDSIRRYFGKGLKQITDFIDRVKEMDGLSFDNIVRAFRDFKTNVLGYFFNFDKLFSKVPDGLISGLVNGIRNGVSKVAEVVLSLGKSILETICDFLGIHSPATTMIEIGKNIILGLIEGIAWGIGKLGELMTDIGSLITTSISGGSIDATGAGNTIVTNLSKAFQNIDWGKVFVAGTLGFGIKIMSDMVKVLDKLFTPLEGLNNILNGVAGVFSSISKGIDKWVNAQKWKIKSEAILNMAKAIAILAASLYVLSKIDAMSLWKAVGAIAALSAILVGLSLAASKINNIQGFGKMSILMLSMAGSLLIISSAIKKLSEIDFEDAMGAVTELLYIMAGMSLLMIAIGKVATKENGEAIAKAGILFLEMSIAIAIMARVIKLLGGLDSSAATQGLGILTVIGLIFTAFILISKYAGEHAALAGKMLMEMAVAVGILAFVIRLLGNIPLSQVTRGLLVLTYVMALFAAMTYVSWYAGKHAAKAGRMLMQASIAIGILAIAIRLMAGLSKKQLKRAMEVIDECFIMFIKFIALSWFAGKNADKAGSLLLKASAAIAILALAIKLIGTISMGDIVKGIAVIYSIGIMFAALVKISQFAGANADKAGKMLLQMSVSIMILSFAIALLSFLDPADIAVATAAIDSLIFTFSYLIAATEKMKIGKGTIGTMVTMVVAIGVLAASIAVLGRLNKSNVVTATACMAALMVMFGTLTRMAKYTKGSEKSVIMMGIVVGLLAAVLYELAQLPVKQTIGAAASLAILMLSLSVALKIIGTIPSISPMALAGMGIMVVVVGLLAVVLGLMGSMNVEPSIETALALAILLNGMAIALIILAGVGAVAPAALVGAGVLGAVLLAIIDVLAIIGAIFSYIPMLEEFLNKGISIMIQVFNGIGQMLGNLAGGFIEGVSDSLPTLAENLSSFMENLKPFIEGANQIDPAMAEGVKSLAQALLYITGADLLNNISAWLVGEDSLAKFGEQLAIFGDSLAAYAKSVAGIDVESIKKSAEGALALAEMAGAIPNQGGALALFTGDNTLAKFAQNLVPFGIAMKMYSLSVAGIDVESIKKSAEGAQALSEMADAIPNQGGALALLIGDNTLAKFAQGLVPFGIAMKVYSLSVAGIDVGAIQNSATAAQSLTKVADSLQNSGGIKQLWSGDKSLSSFGTQIKSLGTAMKSYGDSVAGINIEAINGSISAAKQLSKLTKTLNDVDDIGDLTTFGDKLSTFGGQLNTFNSKIGEFDGSKISGIITELNNLKNFISGLSGFDASGVFAFKVALIQLGTISVDGLVNALTGSYGRVQSAAMGLMRAMAAGFTIGKFAILVSLLATLNSCVSTISSKASAFLAGGLRLGTMLANGLKLGTVTVRLALTITLMQCASAIRGYYGSFYSAGAHLSQGLANGILSKKGTVASAAASVANAAAKAARRALDEHSPSKVFYKIGAFIPQGMANGIIAFGSVVSSAAVSMANSVIDNTKHVISGIGSAINNASNVDIAPTITPVLDMSELQNGSYKLNTSIDLALNKPIEMLSSAMYGSQAEIIQSNLEVVDAIHGLKDDIVGGVKLAITEAFGELAKEPAVINVQQNIDGKQFAKSTVEYYQNEVSKRSIRANRSRGIL